MADDNARRAMFDWAVSVPPADLAAWLMPAFGPDGPKGGTDLRQSDLSSGYGVGIGPRRFPAPRQWASRYWTPCSCWSMPNWSM
jgi:hypothetical protein